MRVLSFALLFFGLGISALSHQVQSAPTAAKNDEVATVDHGPTNEASKLDLTPDAQGNLSQEQMVKLFRIVADKDMENDKRQRDYTYIEREIQNNLDGSGNKKSTEIKTFEILEIYGEQVQRLIAKDDQPLNTKEAAKEEEKIQKIIDKRKN